MYRAILENIEGELWELVDQMNDIPESIGREAKYLHLPDRTVEVPLDATAPQIRAAMQDPNETRKMAKTEAQVSHRQMYRRAVIVVGHEASVLLDNFVCYEWDRGIASSLSYYKFRKAIRSAASKLADHWKT